jgi:hypothetical protein
MSTVEEYHRKLLAILESQGRGGGAGLPEQRAPVGLSAAGHQAVRALIEEIRDEGSPVMTRDVDHYYRQFLAVVRKYLGVHWRSREEALADGVNLDLPYNQKSMEGHQAVQALIEQIHDQGYVLGQLHSDGIFPEGEETEVAALEDRLGVQELKARALLRPSQEDRNYAEEYGHPYTEQGRAALARARHPSRTGVVPPYNPGGALGDGRD